MNITKLIVTAAATAFVASTALANDATKSVDDAWITTKVKADLAKDTDTKANKIHVNTKSGVVVLTGTVASNAEKTKAEQDARSVKGVVDVENQLAVAP